MADDADEADQGLFGAHTRGELGAIGAPGGGDVAQEAQALDLFAGLLDLAPLDGIERAAETNAAERRARGRPKGSANRRNTAVFELLEAKGHRDMAETLSAIQSADTMVLAEYLGAPMTDAKGRVILKPVRDAAGQIIYDEDGEMIREPVYAPADPLKVLAIQRQAAADLMPYKYAKKPQAIELPPQMQRPVMQIGTMNVQQNNQTFLSAGGEGFQALSRAATVRPDEGESHDEAQVIEDAGESDADPTD